MRKTRKWVAAQPVAQKLGIRAKENQDLYDKLAAAGWFWYPKDSQWKQEAPQTSIFETADGQPTGTVRVRLMGNEQDCKSAVFAIRRTLDIAEVSEPYPNRKGPGTRIYVTVQLRKAGK